MSSVKSVAQVVTKESAKSLASNFSSTYYEITFMDNVGVCIECSSVTDNTGSFIVEATIDDPSSASPTWVDLEISPPMTLANADDDILINLTQLPFKAIRVGFTAAGGTPDGQCNIKFMSKRL